MEKKIGRPEKYKPEYAKQAEKLCLLGATDIELANFFEVNEDTIYEWKKKHTEFSEAIKNGKEIADSEVASKLYHRAIGYEHEEDAIFQFQGEPVVVPTIKHYPPDTTAAIFWLKNRQPKQWRDKQEIDTTLSNKDGAAFRIEEVTNMPDEKLEAEIRKLQGEGDA